jgi:hypothetical protein
LNLHELNAPTFANGPDLPWSSIDECKPVLIVHDSHGDHDFTGRFEDVENEELEVIRFQKEGGTCGKLSILNALFVKHPEQFPQPPFGGKTQVLDWLADVYTTTPSTFGVPIGVSGSRGKDLLSYCTDSVLPRLCNPNEIVAIEKYGTKFTNIDIPGSNKLSENNVRLLGVIGSLLKIRLGQLMNFVEHVSERTETRDAQHEEEEFTSTPIHHDEQTKRHKGVPIDSAALFKILDTTAKSNRSTSCRTIDGSSQDKKTPEKPLSNEAKDSNKASEANSFDTDVLETKLENIKRIAKALDVPNTSDDEASLERARSHQSPSRMSSAAPSCRELLLEVTDDASYYKESDMVSRPYLKEESLSSLLAKVQGQLLTSEKISLLHSLEQVAKTVELSQSQKQHEKQQAKSLSVSAPLFPNPTKPPRPVTGFLSKLHAVRKNTSELVQKKSGGIVTSSSPFIKGVIESNPFVTASSCLFRGTQDALQLFESQTDGPVKNNASPTKPETSHPHCEDTSLEILETIPPSSEKSKESVKIEDGSPKNLTTKLPTVKVNQSSQQKSSLLGGSPPTSMWLKTSTEIFRTPIGRPILDEGHISIELPSGILRERPQILGESQSISPTEKAVLRKAHYRMAKACGLPVDIRVAHRKHWHGEMVDLKGKDLVRQNEDPFGMELRPSTPISDSPTKSPTPLPRDENEATFRDTQVPWLMDRMTQPLKLTKRSKRYNKSTLEKLETPQQPFEKVEEEVENIFDRQSAKNIFTESGLMDRFMHNCSQGLRHSPLTLPFSNQVQPGRTKYSGELNLTTNWGYLAKSESLQDAHNSHRVDMWPHQHPNQDMTHRLLETHCQWPTPPHPGSSQGQKLPRAPIMHASIHNTRRPPPGLGFSPKLPAVQSSNHGKHDYSDLLSNLRDVRLPPSYPKRLPTGKPPIPRDHMIHPIDMPQWSEAHRTARQEENINCLPEPHEFRPMPRIPPPGILVQSMLQPPPGEKGYLEELAHRIRPLDAAVRFQTERANQVEQLAGWLHREGQRLNVRINALQQSNIALSDRISLTNMRATVAEAESTRLREENHELQDQCDQWEVHFQFALGQGLSPEDFGL